MNKENSKRANWKPTDNRFVAFIDILGFKDKVMRSSHEDIYFMLESISKLSKTLMEYKVDSIPDGDIHIVNFSDSIAIFSKNDSLDNFEYFVNAVSALFFTMLKLKIPVKGGIAYGKTSVNKENRIFFGQPIIDAFLLEEDVNFFGLVCHSSFDEYYAKNNARIQSTRYRKIIIRQKTALRSGKINHLNFCWFDKGTTRESTKEQVVEMLEQFYSSVSGAPRRYIDNTIDFINSIPQPDKYF